MIHESREAIKCTVIITICTCKVFLFKRRLFRPFFYQPHWFHWKFKGCTITCKPTYQNTTSTRIAIFIFFKNKYIIKSLTLRTKICQFSRTLFSVHSFFLLGCDIYNLDVPKYNTALIIIIITTWRDWFTYQDHLHTSSQFHTREPVDYFFQM